MMTILIILLTCYVIAYIAFEVDRRKHDTSILESQKSTNLLAERMNKMQETYEREITIRNEQIASMRKQVSGRQVDIEECVFGDILVNYEHGYSNFIFIFDHVDDKGVWDCYCAILGEGDVTKGTYFSSGNYRAATNEEVKKFSKLLLSSEYAEEIKLKHPKIIEYADFEDPRKFHSVI